jgi:hypothetical protein
MWSEFIWHTMQNVLDGTIVDLYIVPAIETIKKIEISASLIQRKLTLIPD